MKIKETIKQPEMQIVSLNKTKNNLIWGKDLFVFLLLLFTMPAKTQTSIFQTSTLEKIATGFQFTEGPVWPGDGYLYFSDINGNTINKWNELQGATVFIKPSGNTNGITMKDSLFVIAQQGSRQLGRIEKSGNITVLASKYNGLKLNSPNDVTVKSNGKIYFTDPPYGISAGQSELGYNGVFCFDDASGTLVLLTDTISTPNGIVFSKDESRLYIDDTKRKKIYAYSLKPDGTIQNVSLFASLGTEPDGMKIDSDDNLYVAAGFGGVKAFSSSGLLLDTLSVPEKTTNLCWGGNNGNTLFITAGTSVYRVQCNSSSTGIFQEQKDFPEFNISPNPAEDILNIQSNSPWNTTLKIELINMLGETVISDEIANGRTSLDLNISNIPEGLYIVRIRNGSNSSTHKITVYK